MTFNDIIASINYKIENSNFERFTVPQVIDELNNTYRDLANKTSLFETVDYMELADGVPTYTLPNRIHRPTRAMYRGDQIDFVSQEAMDKNLPNWETETTEQLLEYLVYNNQTKRQVQVYPVLTAIDADYNSEDVKYLGQLSDVSDSTEVYLYISSLTGAKYVADSYAAYGTISDLNLREVVTIYGAYLPTKVSQENLGSSDIHIPEINANALIYGTAGNLLFTSGRTEDAQKAQNFMKLYGVDETEVAAIRNTDFSGTFRNTKRNNNYRTPFTK